MSLLGPDPESTTSQLLTVKQNLFRHHLSDRNLSPSIKSKWWLQQETIPRIQTEKQCIWKFEDMFYLTMDGRPPPSKKSTSIFSIHVKNVSIPPLSIFIQSHITVWLVRHWTRLCLDSRNVFDYPKILIKLQFKQCCSWIRDLKILSFFT